MKLTLSNVKEIKRNSDSPLTKRVCNYVIGRWGDYNDKKPRCPRKATLFSKSSSKRLPKAKTRRC